MGIPQAAGEFLSFLRYPIFDYKRDQPLSFGMVTLLFFVVFAVEMLLFAPMSLLLGLEDMPHAMQDVLENLASWKVFLVAVIIAPIAEEFIFRFHLRYESLLFLFLLFMMVLFVALFSGSFTEINNIVQLNASDSLQPVTIRSENLVNLWPLFLTIFLALVFGLIYVVSEKFQSAADAFSTNQFPMIFYWTAAVFALVHVFNFELDSDRWYIAPLLVFPQFFLALYLGYLRVRNNIFYSIYVHALNNSIPMILVLIYGVK